MVLEQSELVVALLALNWGWGHEPGMWQLPQEDRGAHCLLEGSQQHFNLHPLGLILEPCLTNLKNDTLCVFMPLSLFAKPTVKTPNTFGIVRPL